MEADSAFVLCRTDGSIVAGNAVWEQLLAGTGATRSTINEAAAQMAGPALVGFFEQVCAGERAAFSLRLAGRQWQLCGHRLGELILLEMAPAGAAPSLAQIGRWTARLIHDFKNQMGGLKLYASYLKKRWGQADAAAAQAESMEIIEKISAGLDALAEHATLIGKLARPLELRLEPGDLAALVGQLVSRQRPRADESGVTLVSTLAEELPELPFDAQQLRTALQPLLARAVEVTPAGGTVSVVLQPQARGSVLSIADQGAPLSPAQQQTFFDILTNERLNKGALDLALAKRILEAHGGTVEVAAAEAVGTTVRVEF